MSMAENKAIKGLLFLKENIAICSACGYEHYLGTYHQYATNYCPECGCKISN